MIKKFYRIILLNDKTQFNKSFSFNSTGLNFLISIIIIVLLSASFGAFRFIKPHATQQELNILKDNQENMIHFINTIQNTENVDSTIYNEYSEVAEILAHNNQMVPNNAPVKGIVTRGIVQFEQNPHNGLDIAAKFNSPIYSAQEGLIIFSDSLIDFGNTIIISHPNNYITLYSHLNKINVIPREYVKSKQIIGTIGESGNSNGPHLHFEIWKNNIIIDPRDIMKEYKNKDVSVK